MPEKVRPEVESPRFPVRRMSRGDPPKNLPFRGKVDRRGPHRYRDESVPASAEANRGGTTEENNPSPSAAEGFLFPCPLLYPAPFTEKP